MSACASLLDPDCPIAKAHQRLEDAHRSWHQAASNYAHPEAFRDGLNETVKALRGGTWALQQETRLGHDFQKWHDSWHDRIRKDDVLTWLVQSHRHSVSESDLEPASTARVKLMPQGEGPPLAEFTVPPMTAPERIPRELRETRMGPVVNVAKTMVVERQWIADDLHQWEIMDALAHCYAALAEPLHEAHRSRGRDLGPMPEPNPLAATLLGWLPGQPECMSLSAQSKMAVFQLKEGRLLGPEQTTLEGEEGQPELLVDARGGEVDDEVPNPVKKDPLRRAAWYFEEARRRLTADGSYEQRVSLWVPGQEWVSAVLSTADKQDRYQLWARIAHEVERSGAEAVLTIFEVSGRKPAEGQRLVLAGETAQGAHRTFSANFERHGTQIRFGRTRIDDDGRRWYFLDPVREVWNKQA